MEMAARRKRKTASSFKMQWLCEAKAEECRVGMRSNDDDDDDNEVSVVSGCHLRCDLIRGEMFPMGVHVMDESDLEEVRADGPAEASISCSCNTTARTTAASNERP